MVAFIGRSSWGALPPNRDPGVMSKCDAIVLHHTVGLHPQTINDGTVEMRRLDYEALHKTNPDGTLTYSDIPYNLVVGPACVFIGRGPTLNDGATDNDLSTDTVSVSVMGDFRTDEMTPNYIDALIDAVHLCRRVWGPIPVRPHHDYYATQCPGPILEALIPRLNGLTDMDPQQFFEHPLTLSDGEPPTPYKTNVEGWLIYVHREFQIMRQILERLEQRL